VGIPDRDILVRTDRARHDDLFNPPRSGKSCSTPMPAGRSSAVTMARHPWRDHSQIRAPTLFGVVMAGHRLCGVVAFVAVDGSGDSGSVAGRSNPNLYRRGRFPEWPVASLGYFGTPSRRRRCKSSFRANELANGVTRDFRRPDARAPHNPELLDAHLTIYPQSRATAAD